MLKYNKQQLYILTIYNILILVKLLLLVLLFYGVISVAGSKDFPYAIVLRCVYPIVFSQFLCYFLIIIIKLLQQLHNY